VWQQFSRIGGGLTPISVTNILQEADGGRPARMVDLFHESRQKDCHLQSVMGAAETDVTSLDWVVAPPKDPTPAEQECTDALIDAWESADHEAGISHLVGESMAFGYAYAEIDWKLSEKRLIAPTFLRPVSCRRFAFRQSDGELLFDSAGRGNVDRGGEDLVEKYPGKFVAIRRRINGDVAMREGLARCLIWAALGRNWDLRDWLTLGEIGWKPSVIGTYQKGAAQRDIDHLATIIERFTSTGKATVPETVKLLIEWPKNQSSGSGGGTHKELINHLADEMSKAVLEGTLTIDAGTRGARSLGEVQATGRDAVRNSNVRVVTKSLNVGVSAPFAAMNYGDRVRPPRIALVTQDTIDLKAFGEGLEKLRSAGLRRIPAHWVREEAGIPEAQGDEETLDIEVTVDTSGMGESGSEDTSNDGGSN
jgi:phage gp29-like protein